MSGTGASACPFCAIARGDDQSVEVVCEDEAWIAFFPPEPATPGHTLVVPREHVVDLWAAHPELAAELMRAASEVGRAVQAALRPDGMNLITSAGEAAEQTVFHVHLHVVPRWVDDGFGRIWPPQEPLRRDIEQDVAGSIRAECARRREP